MPKLGPNKDFLIIYFIYKLRSFPSILHPSSHSKENMGIFNLILFVQVLLISLFSSSHSLFPHRHHFIHHHHHHHHPHTNANNGSYVTKYFTQTLDHFDYTPESYKTFQQRYLINTTSWGGAKKGSPIFVFIGAQDDIQHIAGSKGYMFEINKVFKAMLVFIEHRYYGKSIPYGGKEVAYRNSSTLGYLNAKQALADVATLVTDLKKNVSALGSPVIVFGSGYAGNLATWFRLKYPHVALGALASSAPILDFDNIVSPHSFTDIITKNIKSESKNCYKTIKNSWGEFEKTLKQKGGNDKLSNSLKICTPHPRKDDLRDKLFGLIELALIYSSLSDYPYESNIHTPLPPFPVKKMCAAIDHPKGASDTASRIFGALNIFYNHTGKSPCFNLTSDNKSNGIEAWKWQACTELVEPSIKNDNDSIFPHNYKHQHKQSSFGCGKNVKPRPHSITTEFGGHDLKRVLKRFGSNIIFYNGKRDPISAGGVLESISKSIVAIVAQEGAHEADLLYPKKNDAEWLEKVRNKEVKIIRKWLEEYYNDDNDDDN